MFKRRIGRARYWGLVVGLFVAGYLLSFIPAASFGVTFAWLLLYAWRLHDFGRSGWWAVGVFVAVMALAIVGLVLNLDAAMFYLEGQGEAPTPEGNLVFVVFVGGALLIQLALTIWLGVVRGDAGENRYGDRWGEKRPSPTADTFS